MTLITCEMCTRDMPGHPGDTVCAECHEASPATAAALDNPPEPAVPVSLLRDLIRRWDAQHDSSERVTLGLYQATLDLELLIDRHAAAKREEG